MKAQRRIRRRVLLHVGVRRVDICRVARNYGTEVACEVLRRLVMGRLGVRHR